MHDMSSSALFVIAGVLAIVIFVRRCFRKTEIKKKSASVMIIAGSGGHTAEILGLVSSLDIKYYPRIYVLANTDNLSLKKIIAIEQEQKINEKYFVAKIPRSREVHQSWLTTGLTTLYATLYSFPLVFKWKPDILLCNGPGTCIPVCAVALILKMFKIVKTKIFYVESVARVYDLSLSGKILYYFADYLFVQWPELHETYPKTIYVGRLSS